MEPRQEVERPKEPRHCQNSKPGPKTQKREKKPSSLNTEGEGVEQKYS